jgi:hypothetical protein
LSIRVSTYVWEHSNQRGTALLLMLAIADHAHDDGGGAYPSVETLARKSRTTTRNVRLLLPKLEAAGELEVKRGAGPHGTNLYRVKHFHPLKNIPPKVNDGSNNGSGEVGFRGNAHEISPPDAEDFSPYNLADYLESKRRRQHPR